MRKADLWFAAYFFAMGWLVCEYAPELRQLAADTAAAAVDWTAGRALDVADERKAGQLDGQAADPASLSRSA